MIFSKIIKQAFDKSESIETTVINDYKTGISPNLSRIFTILIQTAGQYCENYASDILYDIARIKETIANINTQTDNTECELVGIRKNGVDGNEYIKSRFYGSDIDEYHKVFAVKLSFAANTATLTCDLKNITSVLLQAYKQINNTDNIDTQCDEIINNLSSAQKDLIYRKLWYDHVLEDVDSNFANVSDDIKKEVARRYVYDGDYDCNRSYWDNLQALTDDVSYWYNLS
mgnify:CR=1 FL=1